MSFLNDVKEGKATPRDALDVLGNLTTLIPERKEARSMVTAAYTILDEWLQEHGFPRSEFS